MTKPEKQDDSEGAKSGLQVRGLCLSPTQPNACTPEIASRDFCLSHMRYY
jgi:hypothetical protein